MFVFNYEQIVCSFLVVNVTEPLMIYTFKLFLTLRSIQINHVVDSLNKFSSELIGSIVVFFFIPIVCARPI